MVEIGTQFQPEVALFDTGADINSLSYEAWEQIDKHSANLLPHLLHLLERPIQLKGILNCLYVLGTLIFTIAFMS